jgi:hypothetical protein
MLIERDGSGRAPDSLKFKNLAAPAVRRSRIGGCVLAAGQTNNPEERELLLKWAQDWRAAAREGLIQSTSK